MVYCRQALGARCLHFEVDSTESVWYRVWVWDPGGGVILKLTPQSQYGIVRPLAHAVSVYFEVDSTESVWYNTWGRVFPSFAF